VGTDAHGNGGRWRPGATATDTRVCPPGTGHSPEEEQ
jgi:hypothetical protein